MEEHSLLGSFCRAAGCAVLAFGMSPSWAVPTSLEITGTLLDGSGNKINAPFIIFAEGIYDSAVGGSLLASLGPENVQVGNGSFLQVFSVDDSLFDATAYLQVRLNGFDMAPRLGIFFNGTYFFASGETSGGPAGATLFQVYAGLSAPPAVPEPQIAALLLGGLAFVGTLAARSRRAAAGPASRGG